MSRTSYAVCRAIGKHARSTVLIVAAASLLAGCGYSLHHRLRSEFGEAPGIVVPVFSNETEETGVERYFTDACLRELRSQGLVVFGTRKEGAHELRGTVESVTQTATAFTNNGFGGLNSFRRLPTEIVLSIVLRFELIDPKTGRSTWTQRFSGFRRVEAPVDRTFDYQAPSSLGLRVQTLMETRHAEIARDIMRDLYDAMVDQWKT